MGSTESAVDATKIAQRFIDFANDKHRVRSLLGVLVQTLCANHAAPNRRLYQYPGEVRELIFDLGFEILFFGGI